MNSSDYILITPAHNEQEFIEQTIESVVNQSVRPVRWIVVDDASTDGTSGIVDRYCSRHDFIRTVRIQREHGRSFGNKVLAFNRGLAELEGIPWAYVGNLDADISLEPDYYESLLREFDNDEQLGVAGGMVHSWTNRKFVSQNVALDSVAGAIQLFRRACFADIGGYVPLPHGGIDSAAEIKARMKGWKVKTFSRYRVDEHRRTGSATFGTLASRLREGRLYHSLGYSFLFQLARCTYRARQQPFILGSVAELTGYVLGAVSRDPFSLQPEVIRYLRIEQRKKLRQLIERGESSVSL